MFRDGVSVSQLMVREQQTKERLPMTRHEPNNVAPSVSAVMSAKEVASASTVDYEIIGEPPELGGSRT